MKIENVPFGTTDWSAVPPSERPGETGWATWRTQHFGSIRVRMVEFSPGYVDDHWNRKGHVLLCLDGELETETPDGRTYVLKPGVSYQVADGSLPLRSRTSVGAKLFIVD